MKRLIFAVFTVFLLAACSQSAGSIKTEDVISAFKDAGLEAENVRELTKDDYGMAPMKAEGGKYFYLPSLGENKGARLFTYDSESDLDEMKKFYDDLGKESGMLFSWTIKHKNILIQMNGDLPEEKYNEYKKALKEL